MIKRYCDICGIEINDSNKVGFDDGFRLTGKLESKPGHLKKNVLRIEVITSKDNLWNDGDFCKYCVIDCINKNDDRPKQGFPTSGD